MDKRIEYLKRILKNQIDWYHENKADEGLLYDEMIEQFRYLGRGDYLTIVAILAED